MTTKAQIEAAKEALKKREQERMDWVDTPMRELRLRCDAEAAITAATEAEEPHPMSGEAFTRWAHRQTPLTAAAEAGWPSDELIDNLVASATEEDRLTKVGPHPAAVEAGQKQHSPEWHIIQATIERCAQELDKRATLAEQETGEEMEMLADELADAAAAIRALKEQP